MEFFKDQHFLTMVGIKSNAIFPAIVGDTANTFGVVALKNPTGLARSTCTKERSLLPAA